jgi:uncharacterized protein YbaR (Trm112 family)
LLDILVCPTTKVKVVPLGEAKLAALNKAIASGQVSRADGERVTKTLAEALITTDGKTIYKIEDEIPIMLAEEAIATETLGLA